MRAVKTRQACSASISLILAMVLTHPSAIKAELQPEECLIIYNTNSPPSLDIATYYAAIRRIPPDQAIGIALPIADELRRDTYENRVLPAIRKAIKNNTWGSRIRCLVTCYDIPLRISKANPDAKDAQRAETLYQRLIKTEKTIRSIITALENIAHNNAKDAAPGNTDPPGPKSHRPKSPRPKSRKPESPRPEPGKSLTEAATFKALHKQYTQALTEIQIDRLADASVPSKVDKRKIITQVVQMEGLAGAIIRLRKQLEHESDEQTANRLKKLERKVARQEKEFVKLFSTDASTDDFDRGLQILKETRGWFGVANALANRIRLLRGHQSASAFDSELTLAMQPKYGLTGWRPAKLSQRERLFMVARLDGPHPIIVRRMIDDAVAVEKTGLRGVVYIDARGISDDEGYAEYDNDLRDLAKLVRTQTTLPSVLDTAPEVFKPESCPNAALYCGWYSLANYVDAFDFVRGAVAFHLASFEMVSLHDPTKKYWCKSLLSDGVTATLGPTSEPYLQSFPKPTAFFGLLMTGRYTLAEVFAMTSPYVSWQITLVGDPLYNPFRNNPQLPTTWKPR